MAWQVFLACIVLLIITVVLTFTNQFCVGPIGFGLCYKSASDPACPVCPPVMPSPVAPAHSPTTTSTYEPEPYTMG